MNECFKLQKFCYNRVRKQRNPLYVCSVKNYTSMIPMSVRNGKNECPVLAKQNQIVVLSLELTNNFSALFFAFFFSHFFFNSLSLFSFWLSMFELQEMEVEILVFHLSSGGPNEKKTLWSPSENAPVACLRTVAGRREDGKKAVFSFGHFLTFLRRTEMPLMTALCFRIARTWHMNLYTKSEVGVSMSERTSEWGKRTM